MTGRFAGIFNQEPLIEEEVESSPVKKPAKNRQTGKGQKSEPSKPRAAKTERANLASPKSEQPRLQPKPQPEIPQPAREPLTQVSGYIPKKLHKDVKVALAHLDDRLTFTDLMIQLLTEWLKKQK